MVKGAGWGHMTQPEPMSMFLRIHIAPGREDNCTFSLGSLTGEEMPENRERPTQKLFGCPGLPLKLSSYVSPLISSFG